MNYTKIGSSYDLLIAFVRHLYQEFHFDSEEIIAVLEKPWKWQDEYDSWLKERHEK